MMNAYKGVIVLEGNYPNWSVFDWILYISVQGEDCIAVSRGISRPNGLLDQVSVTDIFFQTS